LYRPWVGFGELKRTAANISSTGVISSKSSQGGFSAATVLLAITLLGGGATLQVIASEAETLAAQTPGLAAIESTIKILYTDLAMRFLMAVIFLGYLASLLHDISQSMKLAANQKSATVFE
jgi:hypothetical protein